MAPIIKPIPSCKTTRVWQTLNIGTGSILEKRMGYPCVWNIAGCGRRVWSRVDFQPTPIIRLESVRYHIRGCDRRNREISAPPHSLDTGVWVLEATTVGILWVPCLFRIRVLQWRGHPNDWRVSFHPHHDDWHQSSIRKLYRVSTISLPPFLN